ncbi:hypothetical protein GCM10010297_58300 [Streptomyces malachitofuscus]|nr:hypothetical protein GCM10010297_58300 [Streptomyces malachitofuscus]
MRDPFPLPAAQLQPPLLGHRLLTVGPGGLREQGEHRVGLLGGERGVGLERTGPAGPCEVVVAGHAYEGKGRAPEGAAMRPAGVPVRGPQERRRKINQVVTLKPLSRYAR